MFDPKVVINIYEDEGKKTYDFYKLFKEVKFPEVEIETNNGKIPLTFCIHAVIQFTWRAYIDDLYSPKKFGNYYDIKNFMKYMTSVFNKGERYFDIDTMDIDGEMQRNSIYWGCSRWRFVIDPAHNKVITFITRKNRYKNIIDARGALIKEGFFKTKLIESSCR